MTEQTTNRRAEDKNVQVLATKIEGLAQDMSEMKHGITGGSQRLVCGHRCVGSRRYGGAGQAGPEVDSAGAVMFRALVLSLLCVTAQAQTAEQAAAADVGTTAIGLAVGAAEASRRLTCEFTKPT